MENVSKPQEEPTVVEEVKHVKTILLSYLQTGVSRLDEMTKYLALVERKIFNTAEVETLPSRDLIQKYRLASEQITSLVDTFKKILSRDFSEEYFKESDSLKTLLQSLSPATVKKIRAVIESELNTGEEIKNMDLPAKFK